MPTVTRRPSGLWVPSSVADAAPRGVNVRLPQDLEPPRVPVAIVRRAPSGVDLLGVGPDEQALGVPVSTPEQVVAYAAAQPFEAAMLMLSWLDAALFATGPTRMAQLAVAEEFFGPNTPVARRLATWVHTDESHFAFDERHLATFRALLVLHAQDSALGGPEVDPELFTRGLFGPSALFDEASGAPEEGQAGWGPWIGFLVRAAAYYDSRSPLHTVALAHALWVDLAHRPELLESPDFCPIDDWLREDHGIAADEQLAIGFMLLAAAGVMNEDAAFTERAIVAAEFGGDSTLAGREADVIALVGADREEYRQRLAELDLGALMWDRTVFEQRPLLRLADGRLLVTSPRALWSWTGDGLYYRLHDAARRRDQLERFSQFYGTLSERYVLELVASAHPPPRPLSAGRVVGEQVAGTRKAPIKTPDVAVDLGPDLVLMEVVSGRLTLRTRVSGDTEALEGDLFKLVDKKLGQLSRRIHDLLAGRISLPDVRRDHVRRVWPVLVTTEGLAVAEPLWERIRRAHSGLFTDARVQPPAILDREELEHLMALVEEGESLSDLLSARAASAYSDLPVRKVAAGRAPGGGDATAAVVRARPMGSRDAAAARGALPGAAVAATRAIARSHRVPRGDSAYARACSLMVAEGSGHRRRRPRRGLRRSPSTRRNGCPTGLPVSRPLPHRPAGASIRTPATWMRHSSRAVVCVAPARVLALVAHSGSEYVVSAGTDGCPVRCRATATRPRGARAWASTRSPARALPGGGARRPPWFSRGSRRPARSARRAFVRRCSRRAAPGGRRR
jgi:hypothetical protein